jgi:cytochrome b pre-mRNA-processing protein 3
MLATLRKLFHSASPKEATDAYIALVIHARNPFFYESLFVPDTLDGRFELIVLHLFLLQYRLRDENPEFTRYLSELFFADMDRSLREMGVADTGVRYRIKAMAKAYHGRLQAYGLSLTDPEALRAALARNLYGTVKEGSVNALARMATYVMHVHTTFQEIPASAFAEGRFTWPTPA